MTATITATNGAGTTSPLTITSPWATGWASRSVVHNLIGGGIAVSLVAPRPRAGTMELLYPDEASAFECVALHRMATSFSVVDTDRGSVAMVYVVDGEVGARLDEGTLNLYVVSIGYQEVIP